MPKQRQSVRLHGGVNRLKNGDITRPNRLENCQMILNGVVRSVNRPTEDAEETTDSKPYIEWNGKMLDRAGYSTDEDGSQISARVISQDTLNSRLYRSVVGEDLGSNPNYRIVKHFRDYDEDVSTTEGFQGEPAIAYDSSFTLIDFTDYSFVTNVTTPSSNKIEDDSHVGYIAIPYDKNGEAGPWFYFTILRQAQLVSAGAPTIDLITPADVTVFCNEETDRVDIYRTFDLTNRGFVHPGPIPLTNLTSGDGEIPYGFEGDHRVFFFGNFKTSINNATGVNEINFHDDQVWVTETVLAAIHSEVTYIATSEEFLVWALPFTAPYNQINNKIKSPSQLLTRGRNVLSIHADDESSNPYQYHGISAEVMAANGDIMMYGNVRVPTKRPSTGLVFYKEQAPFANIDFQLEYQDSQGNVFYGPKETFSAVESILFAWQGETALLVFVGGELFERILPNTDGTYTTGYRPIEALDEGFQPAVSYIVNSDNDSTTFDEDPNATVVDYIQEPSLILLSESNRPMEVTYDSFLVKTDEVVRAILPARIAEQESLRAYDFYTMTNKTIRAYTRQGEDLRTIVPVHDITFNLGVLQSTFTVVPGTEPTTITLATPTRFGVAFVGTDERLYHLIGRELTQLDIEIPGLFSGYGGYRDIVFDATENELWVLFNNSAIEVYSFIQQGWVKNHFLSNVHFNLYYRESTGNIHSWGREDNINYHTYKFDDDDVNIHPSPRIWTRQIDDGGQEVQVVSMVVDYAATNYSNTDKTEWATLRHSTRNPSILQAEEVSSPTKRKVEYQIPANRPFYPILVGRGHQFLLSNFEELRDIELEFSRADH